MPLVGGIGSSKPGDETSSGVLNQVKGQLLEKVGGSRATLTEDTFSPVTHSYKTQVVAGTNFFIKVKLAENDFIHVRIYRDLAGNVELVSVSEDKTESEEITYF